MKLNIKAFKKLFKTQFKNNYHEAARQLGAQASQIHRIINSGQKAGLLFLERLYLWCAKNNVDYNALIFLPLPLTDANEGAQ